MHTACRVSGRTPAGPQMPPPHSYLHHEKSWSSSLWNCSYCPAERAWPPPLLATTVDPKSWPSFSPPFLCSWLCSSQASGYSSLCWPVLELSYPSPGLLPALKEGSHQACPQVHSHLPAGAGTRHLPTHVQPGISKVLKAQDRQGQDGVLFPWSPGTGGNLA